MSVPVRRGSGDGGSTKREDPALDVRLTLRLAATGGGHVAGVLDGRTRPRVALPHTRRRVTHPGRDLRRAPLSIPRGRVQDTGPPSMWGRPPRPVQHWERYGQKTENSNPVLT